MKPVSRLLQRTFILTVVLALCSAARLASGQTVSWSGTDAIANVNTNWSDMNNWSGLVLPGPGTTALFNNAGVTLGANGPASADNIVNQNFTVPALQYSQTNASAFNMAPTLWHNTLINSGVTLTLSNNNTSLMLECGTQSDPPSGLTYCYSTIGGPGVLVLNNTNGGSTIFVGQGSGTYAGDQNQFAQLDMSGLNTFQATVGRLMLGVEGVGATPGQATLFNNPRTTAYMYLAATNNITLAQTGSVAELAHAAAVGPALTVADTYESFSDFQCWLCLGLVNTINADTITIGRVQSYHTAVLTFNTSTYVPVQPITLIPPVQAFVGSTLTLRGTSAARVSSFMVADNTEGPGNAACCIPKGQSPDLMVQPAYDTTVPIGCAGMVDLSGGTSDIKVDSLIVAKGYAGGGGGKVLGVFNMGAGTLDVNTLQLGVLSSASATVPVSGWFSVTSGSVQVNSNDVALGVGTAAIATGYLGVTNGSFTVGNGYGIIDNGESLSDIELTGGTLSAAYIGSASAPIGSVTMADSTLDLPLNNLQGALITGSLTNESTSSGITINITSIGPAPGLQPIVTVISSGNPISYQNGANSSTFHLGTVPAGFAGHLQVTANQVQLVITTSPVVPDSWTGADVSIGHTNWSDLNNWSGHVEPSANNPAYFFNTGSVGSSALSTPGGGPGAFLPAKINNIVDSNVTTFGLTYANTNGTYQNTFIPSGDSLTLSANAVGLTVGSQVLDYGNTTDNDTISGGAGVLSVNTSLTVGLGDNTPGSTPKATLDMSALGTFNANVQDFLIGVGYTVNQPAGIVYLAQTNSITATSPQADTSDARPVALEVGDTPTMAGSIASALYLGQTNTINANAISVGRQLATGGIFFNPALTNSNPTVSTGPWAYFRGASGGASAVGTWSIGNGVANPGAVNGNGTVNLTGGYVNALVNTLTVANSSSSSTSNTAVIGTLTFNAGTINANTLTVSGNNAYSDGNVYNYGVGTVNVNGTASLVVNNTLNLSLKGGPLSGASPSATLNINGASASVAANAIVADAGATTTINVTSGSLAATNGVGTASAPVTSLNVTNATIIVGATAAPFINAQSINAGGASNTITLKSLPNVIEHYPVTFTVLQSGTAIVGYNFHVGLPTNYVGSASESGDSKAVLVTLTSGPIGSRGTVLWTGMDYLNLVSTNWSAATNWAASALGFAAVPGPHDRTLFSTNGETIASGDGAAYVDNIVDQNFTVGSVWFTQTNSAAYSPGAFVSHNTVINPGVTLTLADTNITIMLESGTQSDPPDGITYCISTISGGGTLILNNTNVGSAICVQQGSATYTGAAGLSATLDMSGLNTFQATVGRLMLGVRGENPPYPAGQVPLFNNARASGNLLLATNTVLNLTQLGNPGPGADAAIAGPALVVGDTSFYGDNPSYLSLGLSNIINADTITIARNGMLQSGVLQFNTTAYPIGSTLRLRGTSAGRVAEFDVADCTLNGNGSQYEAPDPRITVTPQISGGFHVAESGLVDVSAGTSDIMIDTLILGRGFAANGGSGYVVGQFSMGAGTMNVNTLELGLLSFPNPNAPVTGILNVPAGGVVVVNTVLALGVPLGGTTANAVGNLNINGGAVSAADITASGSTNSSITVNGGTLSLTSVAGSIGTAAAPVGSLTINGTATINLADGSSAGPVVTGNLAASATTTINATALPLIASVPTTIPLIQSESPIVGAGNFVLGSLPSGYVGTLGVNASNTAIQLTITTAPFPPKGTTITSVTFSGGNIVLAGTNGLANGVYYVLSSTNVTTHLQAWTIIDKGSFDANGNFNIAIPATNSLSFYAIKSQ